MSIDKERAAVASAYRKLRLAQHRYRGNSRALEALIVRRRSVWLVCAGLGAGLVAGRLPVARLLRSATTLFSFGTSILRTPLGAMAIGAVVGKKRSDPIA